MTAKASGWEPVYRVVRRIPAGRVASYGQVAALAGMPRAARQVGYALHALAVESPVPWHRVVNARGEISARGPTESVPLQRSRLEAEGVVFGAAGRIDLERFGWAPRAERAARPTRKGTTRTAGTTKPTGRTEARSDGKRASTPPSDRPKRSEREPRGIRRPGRGSNA